MKAYGADPIAVISLSQRGLAKPAAGNTAINARLILRQRSARPDTAINPPDNLCQMQQISHLAFAFSRETGA